jgi:hypothetical protein
MMANNRFAKAMGRVTNALRGPTRRHMEDAYLSNSTSIYDLERRMKEVERGKFSNF